MQSCPRGESLLVACHPLILFHFSVRGNESLKFTTSLSAEQGALGITVSYRHFAYIFLASLCGLIRPAFMSASPLSIALFSSFVISSPFRLSLSCHVIELIVSKHGRPTMTKPMNEDKNS